MSKFDSTVDETNMLMRVRRAFKDGVFNCYPVITRKVIGAVEYVYIGTRFRISKHLENDLFVVEDLHVSKRAPIWKRQWNDTICGMYLHVIGHYGENTTVGSQLSARDLAEMIRDKMLTTSRMWNTVRKRERFIIKQANLEVKAMYATARNAIKLVAKQKDLK